MPDDQLNDARQLGMQDLRALEDEPAHRCFSELKRFRFPLPYGRISQGTREGLAAIDQDKLLHFFQNNYHPSGSILAVAGNFDWNELNATVERAYGDWSGPTEPKLPPLKPRFGSRHTDHASNQTHLALAYDCAPYEEQRVLHGASVGGNPERRNEFEVVH